MTQTGHEVSGTGQFEELARRLRVDSIRCSSAVGSGHPTSSMSAADLMAVLLGKYLRYDFGEPENPANDHLIFSKGHASPLLYSMYCAAGAISNDELLSLRRSGSRLQGHPTPDLPWVDVATGSLGQGLPVGVGVALAGKKLEGDPYRVWVLCGDSEMAEGSMTEALRHAAYNGLGNITAVLDMNRLGQTRETMYGWDGDTYERQARALGWETVQVDGHDLEAIDKALAYSERDRDVPTFVIARTVKGKGVSFLENREGLHGKPVEPGREDEAINELGGESDLIIEVQKPDPSEARTAFTQPDVELPTYKVGEIVPTRKAYGETLAALGAMEDIVALDGEVSNSTHSEDFREAHPDRYFEMFIAEQQMISTAVGLQVRGYRPFASSFAAFLTRAYDFIRMAAVSRADIRLSGSHAGVSIGEDGPSQMGLEDIAMMRAVHGSTVLHPCDGNQTAKLVREMADLEGISYIRTLRPGTDVIYGPDEDFKVGGSRTLRFSDDDLVTIVAAGITVGEALRAADELRGDGINVRVVDAYSIKPIDAESLRDAVAKTEGRVIVVEDHWPEGGLGEAVLSALAGVEVRFGHLAVRGMPGAGSSEELLSAAGIDADSISASVRALV